MKTVNVLHISGGKDSTAMWLLALKRGVENLLPVFADTGHEHPETYRYLDYLEQQLGPIRRIKADFTKKIIKKRERIKCEWRKLGISEERIAEAIETLQPTGIPF